MSKQLEKIKQLIEKREQARLGGGEKAIQKQHERGSTQHVSVLTCYSTKAASKSMICLRSTVAITSAWRRSSSLVMV